MFKDVINSLENEKFDADFIIIKGNVPILFTAPHTMKQVRDDGSVKFPELYTKAIALYFNKFFGVNSMIKIKDTGMDSNVDNHDDFKNELIKFVKENNIKLVLDLHGSKQERDYDIELVNIYRKINNPKYIIAPAILPFAGNFVIDSKSINGKVLKMHVQTGRVVLPITTITNNVIT